MELVTDVQSSAGEVKRCIGSYGSAPEHNFAYFLSRTELGGVSLYIKSGEYGLLAAYRPRVAEVMLISLPLAPASEHARLTVEAARLCFDSLGCRKFVVEQVLALRKQSLPLFRSAGFRDLPPRCVFHWPEFNLAEWDGDVLQGERWKDIRNIKNRFYRQHSVQVVDSSSLPKDALRQVVAEWAAGRRNNSDGANREDSNFAYVEPYYRLIDAGFAGVAHAKTLVVDGVPSSITAGWDIPNSDRGYYSAIGVCSYRFDGLAEVASMEDLVMLKAAGYRLVDFGGSSKALLKFKMKLRPTSLYKTIVYAVSR
ncbi:hypothetical protein HYY74_00435 [Candidatus Woesearchaeota archaeon]|nr:hypothetical protein [Candidatus Woesearchaeota archaeon]